MIYAIAFLLTMVVIAIILTRSPKEELEEEFVPKEKSWQKEVARLTPRTLYQDPSFEEEFVDVPATWEGEMRKELTRHRTDPNYVAVLPVTGTSTIQTEEDELWATVREGIMTGMMTPKWARAVLKISAMESQGIMTDGQGIQIMDKFIPLQDLKEIAGLGETEKKKLDNPYRRC